MGGYCFYRDAKLQRLLRYRYNAVPGDLGGRFYYMKEAGKKAWNPGFLPTKTPLDRYECRHGMGYTVFDSAKDGLAARMTFFVPVGENCEIHDLVLTNETQEDKEVHLYGCMEWCLWNAVDDSTNYQRNLNIAECEAEDRILYHKTEYRERRDHYAYYAVNRDTAGWDTDRNAFLGPMGDWSAPALVERESSAFSCITGWYPIGCHHLKIALAPGESQRVPFSCGLWQEPQGTEISVPRRYPQGRRPRRSGKICRPRCRRCCLCSPGPLLGQPAEQLSAPLRGRKAGPDGEHLAPVSVHGHLQSEPLRQLL